MIDDRPSETADPEQQLTRLRRRVERERAARLEAEAIAERGLRSLYDINRELDRRVHERVAESERLARQAERAERVKGEILANLSHELRTPLMAVVGALDLLQSEHEADSEYLSAAIAGAGRLRELVDELFEIVDLESGGGRIEREALDIARFVEDFGDHWRMVALKAGLLLVTSVASSSSPLVELDAVRTRRVLDRLTDNAVKYSRSGTITLTVTHRDDEITFAISDEGPGIEPERLSRLLEPFEVGDRSSTRPDQGAGLGLTLARGLVTMMDGHIRVQSELGVGTEVTVALPTRAVVGAADRRR